MSSGVTIRKATPDDLPKIIELAVEMVVHSVSPFREIDELGVREFRRRDLSTLGEAMKQANVGVFMAEDDKQRFLGHVIVVCGYMESSTGETQGWVFDLSVQRDCWDKGIGRLLMEEAESFTLSQGYQYLGLGVTSANARAVGFYERLGFLEERKRMIKKIGNSHA
ncbi:MAG: GNAT family N-acetyltransferase [Candidatus Xenobia bacterium]